MMLENDNLLFVPLCKDHFRRLLEGTVCETCPSKLENEDMVKSLAEKYKGSEKSVGALIMEVQSIRRTCETLSKTCEKLMNQCQQNGEAIESVEHTVNGNGSPGLKQDMAIVKTEIDHIKGGEGKNAQRISNVIALIGVVTAVIIGMIALIK